METLDSPCSLEELFNVTPPSLPPAITPVSLPKPKSAAVIVPLMQKSNTVLVRDAVQANPVTGPTISPQLHVPLKAVPDTPKSIVIETGKKLSLPWIMVLSCIGGVVLGYAIQKWIRRREEKINEKIA